MKIGVLTSSRADFGIYLPLLMKLNEDIYFDLEIIAFGTHLSVNHGFTVNEIEKYEFPFVHRLETVPESDSPISIAQSMGKTQVMFARFWEENVFDLVLTLGDRYEMFAAVASGTPFNVRFAHIHAGETTLGAIDNAYRHSISLFSDILFVSTETYKKRAEQIVEANTMVCNVGALSIDNLTKINYLSKQEFLDQFQIDLELPTILTTFHPETVSLEKNYRYVSELLASFDVLKNCYQIVVTMPNTDTMGQMVRDRITGYHRLNPDIKVVESFGMLGYLSCMKHCSFLLGNTSSGFVEASYFPKFVINLGDRQKGRIETDNIFTTAVDKKAILNQVNIIENMELPSLQNIYGEGDAATKIVSEIKELVL